MFRAKAGWTDQRVEQFVGNLLRAGVLTAALVVLVGGIRYLIDHRSDPAEPLIHGESSPRSPGAILDGVVELRSQSFIELGLLLLIATPVARVVLCLFAFARQRDWTFVVVTLIVLTILLYSFFKGHV